VYIRGVGEFIKYLSVICAAAPWVNWTSCQSNVLADRCAILRQLQLRYLRKRWTILDRVLASLLQIYQLLLLLLLLLLLRILILRSMSKRLSVDVSPKTSLLHHLSRHCQCQSACNAWVITVQGWQTRVLLCMLPELFSCSRTCPPDHKVPAGLKIRNLIMVYAIRF